MRVKPRKTDWRPAPFILVSPDTEAKGSEMGDASLSLSEAYQRSIMAAGGVPLALPTVASPEMVAECVRRCDGVLLTGGDDINPGLYARRVSSKLARTVMAAPVSRDLRELTLIDEVFRQHRPVLGICRGHQMLNVALGGTLIVDIRSQLPEAIQHARMDRKAEIVHEARLTEESMLARITGVRSLGVNSTHHQAVGRVAGPLAVTARSSDGVVEALELKPEASHLLPFFMTVQFHPERLAGRHPAHQAIFDIFTQACALNRESNL